VRPFIVKQLNYDLTPVVGLALVGHHLNRLAPVFTQLDAALPVKSGVANSDILRSYLGLLVKGKSDFEAIENFRSDAFFKQALGIGLLPSSPTLRQRMHARAVERRQIVAMQMPATPEQHRFYSALLFELGAPHNTSAGLSTLERLARDLLRRIAPRMLVVDEVHHLAEVGIEPSVGSRGDSYDKAYASYCTSFERSATDT
jgi:hypothetical protein